MSLIYDYLKIQGKIDSAVNIPPALKKTESKWRIRSDSYRFNSRTVLIILGSCLVGGLFLLLAVKIFTFEESVQVVADSVSIPTMQTRPAPVSLIKEEKVVVQQQEETVPVPAAGSQTPEQAGVLSESAIQVFPEAESTATGEAEAIQQQANFTAEQSVAVRKEIPQMLELDRSVLKIKFPEEIPIYTEVAKPADKVTQDFAFHDDVAVPGAYQPRDSQDNMVDVSSSATRKSSIVDNRFYLPIKPDSTALHRSKKFYQAGLQAQQSGDQRDAEIYYNKTLEELPLHLEAMVNLSALYVQQQRYAEAEIILADILRIDHGNSKALVNMGVINLYRYNDPLAEELFLAALDGNPLEENALVNLAYLAEKRQDFVTMERYYRQLLQISPDNVEVLLSYGHLLEVEKRYSEAVALYGDCLKLDILKRDQQLYEKIAQRIRLLAGAVRRN